MTWQMLGFGTTYNTANSYFYEYWVFFKMIWYLQLISNVRYISSVSKKITSYYFLRGQHHAIHIPHYFFPRLNTQCCNYRHCHSEYKMVSRPSHLCNRNSNIRKDRFLLSVYFMFYLHVMGTLCEFLLSENMYLLCTEKIMCLLPLSM